MLRNPSRSTALLLALASFVVLVRLAAAQPPPPRNCTIDVTGKAGNDGLVTIVSEQNLSLSQKDITILEDAEAPDVAIQIADSFVGMAGVFSAVASQDDIVVTLASNASVAIFESQEIAHLFFSVPACDLPYAGGPGKVRIALSITRPIVVPDGDTRPRLVEWSVRNISGSALPPNFTVAWTGSSNLLLTGDVTSGAELFGLAPRQVRRFELRAGFDPLDVVRGRQDRGRAFARPNVDPPLDDPALPPIEIAEGPGECIHGDEPAATLLFPYFEVDLAEPGGRTSLLAITNAAEQCTLARLMTWTDLGVPTLSSYLSLSPGDVQTVNLRDLFQGQLPDTAATFASPECAAAGPPACQAADLGADLSAAAAAALRAAHTGAPDPAHGTCAGQDLGDGVARGYVTVDVVDRCAFPPTVETWAHEEWLPVPGDEGFFAATGTAFQNSLWGDLLTVDPQQNFAHGESAVHVPADAAAFVPGEYTFYGRYSGFDASDGRYPLSSRLNSRFLSGGAFDGGTTLHVWRDNLSPAVSPVACGAAPPWLPLGEAAVTAFDEEEQAIAGEGLAEFCLGGTDGVSFACDVTVPGIAFGFLALDLGHAGGTPAQAWVSPVMSAEGRYSVGFPAVRLNDLCHELMTPLDGEELP